MMASREVYCEDVFEWLNKYPLEDNCSIVASMPDISEFNFTPDEWKQWFEKTAALLLRRTSPHGATLFFQTDIKIEGRWIDKAYLIQKAADSLGHHQLFHKIISRVDIGMATKGKPAYSHLLAFSKDLKLDVNLSTPDILTQLGEKTWERGMGLEVSLLIAKFIKKETQTKLVINPFCGEGSMLAAANYQGLDAIGIERSPKRAEKARILKVEKGSFV
ncbi:MAG: SAM-dependent methyltransferase [Bacteriovoracaceae bacterium]